MLQAVSSKRSKPTGPLLVIDDREQSLVMGVVEACENLNVRHRIDRINPSGDYLMGNLLVETKRPFDLVNSIKSRRIYDQIDRMLSTDYNVSLCIVGSGGIRELSQQYVGSHMMSEMSAVQIEGMIHEFISETVFQRRVPVLHFQSEHDFVRFLKHSYNIDKKRITEAWMSKTGDPVLRAFGVPDGIGLELARVLRDKFGTAWSMMNASDTEILKIRGIGKKKLASIRLAYGR